MKILRLFSLVLLLAFGHAHACDARYLGPNGLECTTCEDARNAPSCSQDGCRADDRDDCRTCCTLVACGEPKGVEAMSPGPTSSLEIDAPPGIIGDLLFGRVRDGEIPSHGIDRPLRAPPSPSRGRSPPASA